jgi:hypothetical protein
MAVLAQRSTKYNNSKDKAVYDQWRRRGLPKTIFHMHRYDHVEGLERQDRLDVGKSHQVDLNQVSSVNAHITQQGLGMGSGSTGQ